MRALLALPLFLAAPVAAETCLGDITVVDGREVCQPIPARDTFDRVLRDYETWRRSEDPVRAGQDGDMDAAREWPDVSPEAPHGGGQADMEELQKLADLIKSHL